MLYKNDFDLDAHLAKLAAEEEALELSKNQAKAIIKAEADKARQEQLKRQVSQELTSRTANLLVQKSIEYNNLDSETYRKVYERTFNIYGQQKAQELFVSSVISLLTHKHYGVESKTARFGNGGLTWNAKSFNSPQELYQAVLTTLHGEEGADFDPLGGSEWFDVVLDSIFEDPTYLPCEATLADRFPLYVQGLVAVNKMSQTNPVELPDAADLTVDDLIYLQGLFGAY
ncbi:hypothetical protein [Nostoc sp. ChiVER01]|uniref:hypothetical protein n=1 Tax=Nostoc sp. ChiVER01 TaxID=3075382 RepID=UPI002AD417DE|nr:hypothetical protein [Nostoc sp. ChiVER01]MDZ8221857.1 hypothetical protein [Nostoc sp. ChiVER01]